MTEAHVPWRQAEIQKPECGRRGGTREEEEEEEAALYRRYGLDYSEGPSESGLPTAHDATDRDVLPHTGQVLTTVAGAERLAGNAVGLEPWSSVKVGEVTVTAVPAQHGPDGMDHITGPAIGFLLAAPDPRDGLCLGRQRLARRRPGDCSSRRDHRGRSPVRGGRPAAPPLDGPYLTLSSDRAAEAARILGVRAVVPVHYEGWSHFTQGEAELRAAFAGNGVSDLLVMAERGGTVTV